MANANATRTIDLLGKQIEILETHTGHPIRVSGLVESVVCSLPGTGVEEAVFVDRDWRPLCYCEIINVG